MLWWLLLLLIPLIVHLFNFRRYKKVIFSNTQFLRDVAKQTKKTKQLKKYLLLSTRSLLISCLVLAFAIPYCGDKKTASLPQHFLVYLDNSASVQLQFEEIKNKAREIAKLTGNKDKISILTANNGLVSFVDKEECMNYIDAIELSSFGGDVNVIYQEQQRLTGSELVHTFVISDFQINLKSGFKDSLKNTWLLPVSAEQQVNVGIDSTYLNSPVNAVNGEYELAALVHNYSNKPISDVPLSLFINDKVISSSSVSLDANQTQEVSLPFTKSQSSYLSGLLRIDMEDLAFDNQLYFSLKPQKDKIKILLLGRDNEFIASVFKTEGIFEYSVASNLPSNLDAYGLVIFNGKNSSADQSTVLRNFVSNGGTVLLIPSEDGDNTDFSYLGVSNWSQVDANLINLSKIDFEHPLYQNVYKSIPKNPVEPRIRKHYRIAAQGTGRTILSTANEHPILVEATNGSGKIYQFAIPINKQWSDLPIVGYLFYPTMSNIAMGSARTRPLYGWIGNKINPIEVEPVKLQGVEQFQLKRGISEGVEVYTAELINRLEKTYLIPALSIKEAGIYKLINSSTNASISQIALNVERSESNLNFMDESSLQKFASQVGAEVYQNELEAHPIFKSKRGLLDTTWKWFIVFALIFILIEIFLLRFI